MSTRRLFEEQVTLRQFETQVEEVREKKGRWEARLSATAFFPEGGGQPGDKGTLVLEDGRRVAVLDTKETDGMIWHLLDQEICPGERVTGILDWDFRFRNTQNHSGEHIVSGLIHQKYGYHNVGFHMGSDAVTMDFDGVVKEEDLKEIEAAANRAIEEDVPFEILYPTKEELSSMEYRSKKEIGGQVRIVRIGSYDTCACCGTHVESAGQIRLIKLLGVASYKGGVRISMLAGKDALDDYCRKHDLVMKAVHLLSAKPEKVEESLEKLIRDKEELKSALIGLQRRIGEEKAAQVPEGSEKVCFVEPAFSMDELREMVNKAALRAKLVLGILPLEEQRCQYVLISNEADVRPLGKELNQRFEGKGGGQPTMVQGTLYGDPEEIRKFFMEV